MSIHHHDADHVYIKYVEMAQKFGSKPIWFSDAFENHGIPNGEGIDFRASAGQVFCGIRTKIQKLVTTGKGQVTLVVGAYAIVENVVINNGGEDLFVFIGPYCELKNILIQTRDKGNFMHFGCGVTDNGGNYYVKGRGVGIFIGHDCMFSTQVHVRTSDSHSIFSYDEGVRLNRDQSVVLGDHVWVGRQVTIGKGTRVGDDVVLGQGSMVSGQLESHAIYAGSPARRVRENVTWDRTNAESLREIAETLSKRARQKGVNLFLRNDKPFVHGRQQRCVAERQAALIEKKYRWLDAIGMD